jgi:hypothetical protein
MGPDEFLWAEEERKFTFDLEHISCHRKKYFIMFKKFRTKISRIRLNILRAHAKFCGEPIFLCVQCKKEKENVP